jgi:hypothetical protein
MGAQNDERHGSHWQIAVAAIKFPLLAVLTCSGGTADSPGEERALHATMETGGVKMEERIALPPAPQSAAEYKAAINELLAEMKRMNEQMDRDREEIDRLKAETESIKAETEPIKAQLQSRLDDLMTRV